MDNNTPNVQQQATKTPEKRPDDTGAVNVDGMIKIFDPNSRKVFVEQKA